MGDVSMFANITLIEVVWLAYGYIGCYLFRWLADVIMCRLKALLIHLWRGLAELSILIGGQCEGLNAGGQR